MRAVVQRVTTACVEVEGETIGAIGAGLLVFLGIEDTDTESDVDYIVGKVTDLRIFDDERGVPNLSVSNIGGSVLLVSQFTLCADARKGRRPSYFHAARPELAIPLYESAITKFSRSVPVETGRFQADMRVSLVNDGPHTILLDSRRNF
ncbi:MAG: D-aminoacyl-tRNA deacylase [Clostridia bacterium]